MALRGPLLKVVPLCFLIGAGMEFFMIKVNIGNTNFYETAKRKEAERRLNEKQNPKEKPLWAQRLEEKYEKNRLAKEAKEKNK
jgi:hypothetical protein